MDATDSDRFATGDLVSRLADVRHLSLGELMTTEDPVVLASLEWIVDQVLNADLDGGCC